uniref:Uncharacterized protein n=1 Tax=Tanacetum cinerariifolium TaxID=118510 RepID=A0A6L2NJF7_TANCI|nr:hypothetical protein [Tanacetum cinerariifolium]
MFGQYDTTYGSQHNVGGVSRQRIRDTRPGPKKKTNERHQPDLTKKTYRKGKELLCVPWTTEEEVALCRSWIRLSIVAYYGKLKKLWEELGDYERMPTSKCGLCECKLGSAFAKRREDEKVHQVLMGLDETLYGTTVVSTKEERGEVMSFAVNTMPRSYGYGDRKKRINARTDKHHDEAKVDVEDHTSRMLIGAGEQREGIYFYKRMVNVMAVTAKDVRCFETWHKRLRRPSSKVVELIPNVIISNGSG